MIRNLQFHFLFIAASAILPFAAQAQSIQFVNQTALFPTTTFHSGNAVGVADMNNDGKDDIVRAAQNSTMYIEYQGMPNAAFTEASFTNTFGNPWGMCIGDIDDNGFNDVFWGTSANARVLTANATGTSYLTTNLTALVGNGSVFTQGCNFADINNDGHIDLFVCHDTGMPKVFFGNGQDSGWVNGQSTLPLAQIPASDNSGNYASIWTDVNADGLIDLMITHCRQGVTQPTDARRIDQVFINNGNGSYTQDVTNWTGLRDGAQGWSTAWGDVDNDGDMDAFVQNYDVNSKMMINNGSGVFTDVMTSSGIAATTTYFGENATFHDFDNDTYLDLMLSGEAYYMYKGNGDGTFTLVTSPFATNFVHAHAVGDLNNDGFLDLFASYCNTYNSPSNINDALWMNDCPNNGNTNHYIKFHLTGGATIGMSNKNAIGAIVKIYGPWGVQVREVRSGEGYGISNSFTLHFGLGTATQVDSTVITWPSGFIDYVYGTPADQTLSVIEGGSPLSTHGHEVQSLELNVYPNPVTDDAVIRLDHFASVGLNNLSVNVYDLNGKLVYSEAAVQRSIIILDRKMFSSGMYMVEVTNKNKRIATKKMIVE